MAFTSTRALQAASGLGGGYTIDQSLRFNDDDSAYLSRTPASAGNRRTFTFSAWVKLGSATGSLALFSSRSSLDTALFRFNNSAIQYYTRDSGGTVTANYISTSLYRDPSAWYQVILSIDSTQATASNRIKIFVNGSEVPLTASTTMAQNLETRINTAVEHSIATQTTQPEYFDGYLSEIHFIDGQALDPSYFGETDEDYGHWKPIRYTGSYGTNGFYLDFSNSGSIGEDQAGSNDWTANNLAATDVVLDSPTNNFATLNPLAKEVNPPTFFEGNLKAAETAGTTWRTGYSWLMSNGKWYWEITPTATSGGYNLTKIGIVSEAENTAAANAQNFTKALWYDMEGTKRQGTSATSYGSSYTTGDIVGVALDMDSNTITFYKNNVSQGQLDLTALNVGTDNVYLAFAVVGYYAVLNAGQDSSFAGNKTAQNNTDENGVGDFYYAPPSGFLALCTANLPDPAVVPGENFNTVLYTGTGATQSITGVGFQPDWTWIKERNNVRSHLLFDAVRGATKYIHSDSTDAETTASGRLDSFDSDGFTLGSHVTTNESGYNYVAWNWKADNTSGSSNTDGSITSTVAANVDAGFSIVAWTGTASAGTIGHGLSQTPDMIIVKNRSAVTAWPVWNSNLGSTSHMFLNTTASEETTYPTEYWNNTAPTSSVFSVGTWQVINGSSDNMIAYCFHSVEGYSKFGSYTGNGSSDGTFVYTGFTPKFVMWKEYAHSGNNWQISDTARTPYNVSQAALFSNLSNAEDTQTKRRVDILSNGFKLRDGADGDNNYSGFSYIYMAFAETPFKYTNAR